MIPQEQLPHLKPLPDIKKRKIGLDKKLRPRVKQINLSWRARRFAEYPATYRKSGMNVGPNNFRSP